MMEDNEKAKLTGTIRVRTQEVRPHTFHGASGEPLEPEGEVNLIKASGWLDGEDIMALSVHVEAPIGHGAIPFLGDYVKVTIERADMGAAGQD